MDKESFSLTKNEQEIMELLWTQGIALSRSKIIERSPHRSWKASSIHILLNQLLEKGAIQVDGYVKTGKNYGRTFAAAITEEEYHVMQFKQSSIYLQSKSAAVTGLVSALVHDEDIDDQTLDELEAMLQVRKNSCK